MTSQQQAFSTALKSLLDAYTELKTSIWHNDEQGGEVDREEELEVCLQDSIREVVSRGDYVEEEVAEVISDLGEALAEIDPDVFQ